MPSKLINAVACILEDVATKVRVFGITRTNKVPYISYINKAGKAISGFIPRSILSKFKGTHIGFKNGCLVVTKLETGDQTVTKLESGDTVEVVGDRYEKAYIWEQGRILNIYDDGWVTVQIGSQLLRFKGEELDLVSKAPVKGANQSTTKAFKQLATWSPYRGVRERAQKIQERQMNWDSVPDEVLFAAAEQAKRDLGF